MPADQLQQLPEVGATIGGKYSVVRLLGEGGMGAVFEVEHVVTRKRFAIKWMAPSLARSHEAIERFTLEARTSCAIDHPNIVEVFDVSSEDGAMYLVMELLRGEALADRMAHGAMDPVECVSLLLPVLHGLHEAHERGIVHRDLKPDNVFLSQPRPGIPVVAKLLDFGISKMQESGDAQSAMRLTAAGMMMGTAHYMAPEQTQDAANVDAQADIYSFGVVLYEGLSGRLPFLADNFGKLVFQIMTEEPPDIRSYVPGLPPALGQVVMQTLAKDPGARPRGARALALQICDSLGLPHTLFAPSGASWGGHSAPPPPARSNSVARPRFGEAADEVDSPSFIGEAPTAPSLEPSISPAPHQEPAMLSAPAGPPPARSEAPVYAANPSIPPAPRHEQAMLSAPAGPPPTRSKAPVYAAILLLLAAIAGVGAAVLSTSADDEVWNTPPPETNPSSQTPAAESETADDGMPTVEQLVAPAAAEEAEEAEEVEEVEETPARRRDPRRRRQRARNMNAQAMSAEMTPSVAADMAPANDDMNAAMSAPSMSAVMTRLQQGSSELGAF